MADFNKFLTQIILIFPEYFQNTFNTKAKGYRTPLKTIFEISAWENEIFTQNIAFSRKYKSIIADFSKFLTQIILIFPEYFQSTFKTKRFQDPI